MTQETPERRCSLVVRFWRVHVPAVVASVYLNEPTTGDLKRLLGECDELIDAIRAELVRRQGSPMD